MDIFSFIFTEKGGTIHMSNVHHFSKQVSSGQCMSFADLLLAQYSMPVFDASPEGLSLSMAAEEPGAHVPAHRAAMGSSLSAEGREGWS